ncbi:MAG: patatin-like phospholipase family protein [Lysobacteraceae bacterium]
MLRRKMDFSAKLISTLLGIAALILPGCAATRTYANRPMDEDLTSVSRANFPDFCKKQKDEECDNDTAFVGLAISGGGSRAANYAAAVMSELDQMGVLQHVDAISSVSGGSLAAAYYATRSGSPLRENNKTLFWQTAKHDLSIEFRTAFVARYLRPDNFAKSTFGSLGRTELMAQVFDKYIFGGERYGDLGAVGPALLINATAINDLHGIPDTTRCANRRTYAQSIRWESISFTEDFFKNCLFSDISTYPISNAVAASAAFPGVFSSVALARFGLDDKIDKIAPQEYLHVIDGGPSDNLGIDGILSRWAISSRAPGKVRKEQCLIIVIDAFASGDIDLKNLVQDPRSMTDRFVDSNFFDSIDSMLNRRRLDTLLRLGIRPSLADIDQSVRVDDFPIEGNNFSFSGNNTTVNEVSPLDILGIDALSLPTSVKEILGMNDPVPKCMTWYIGIDSLKQLVAPDWEFLHEPNVPYDLDRDDEEYQSVIKAFFATDEAMNRVALWDVASRIRTDFDLVGPKKCTSKLLSDVLWAAGIYSVDADVESREKICAWLNKVGKPVSERCAKSVTEKIPVFPIKYVKHENSGYSVECERN